MFNWEEAKYRLIRNYLILLITSLATFGVINIVISRNISAFYVFGFLIVFFIFLVVKRLYRLLFFQYAAIFITILLVYYFALDRKQTHANLFYIDILLAVVFMFDFKKDKYVMVSLFLLMVFLFCLNVFTDFLFIEPFLSESQYHLLFVVTLIYFFLLLALNIVYIIKINNVSKLYMEQTISKSKNSLEYYRKDEVKIEELNALKTELYEDYKGFLHHFQLLFPIFSNKIKELYNLSISDMEILALIKLNYTTGEIAMITNSSLKSIESKKYRLKKKMNLSASDSLYVCVNNY